MLLVRVIVFVVNSDLILLLGLLSVRNCTCFVLKRAALNDMWCSVSVL